MILTIIIVLTIAMVVGILMRRVLGGMVGLYRVVPVNEIHIRILNNKKENFGKGCPNRSYWVIPFTTKLQKLPLVNISIPVEGVKLNDKNMAKFECDIICFVKISDIEKAAEVLTLTHITTALGFDEERLGQDMRTIIESIGRTVATKQTILEIYMDRATLVAAITAEVKDVFSQWGISLVNLELKHIKDTEGSTIISDIERKSAADIRRDADVRVATTEREAKVAQAEAMETYKKREILRDQTVELARQDALILTQQKTAEANMQAVEAERKIQVGKAEIQKQVVEQEAMAQKIKDTTEAEGIANKTYTTGKAEADIVQIKLEAQAAGNVKLAEAMKLVNDSAMGVKAMDISKDIAIAKFAALGQALSAADIKLIMSGEKSGSLFGLDFNAETGANLEQFLQASGIDAEKVKEVIGKFKPLFEKGVQ